MRLYAIGDIHGQLDLLRSAHALVAHDRQRTGDQDAPVIHLGDLVDRGPDSAGVIRYLMAGPARGGPWISLKGNHDNMFVLFMRAPSETDPFLRTDLSWLHPRLGGLTTLASYGIAGPEDLPESELYAEAQAKVPAAHLHFLDALPLYYTGAGAICVHAGLRPHVPLANQTAEDMMWIRTPFHADTSDYGALVVHGHTPVDTPCHYGNRLNLDTGAAYGGPLTVAVIEQGRAYHLTDAGRVPLLPR